MKLVENTHTHRGAAEAAFRARWRLVGFDVRGVLIAFRDVMESQFIQVSGMYKCRAARKKTTTTNRVAWQSQQQQQQPQRTGKPEHIPTKVCFKQVVNYARAKTEIWRVH